MYKGNYIIGIYTYDKYELCETVLDSAQEFSEYIGISLERARKTLSRLFHHKINYIVNDGRRKKVEFIPYEENWII